jgi:hypothetical protein
MVLVMFKFPFIPKEQKFFALFEKSVHNMVEITQMLKEMVDKWEDIEKSVDKITALEHTGDVITHQIMEQLNRTFVTPFDREDIATLAHSLDDVTDFIYAAAVRMLIYKIDHPTPKAKDLAAIILQAALELEKAMPQLRHRAELKKTLPHCVEINRLENVADDIFRAAQAELFNDITDITLIIKWREIYEYMESATDRCEDVSNVLEGVTLKYA